MHSADETRAVLDPCQQPDTSSLSVLVVWSDAKRLKLDRRRVYPEWQL